MNRQLFRRATIAALACALAACGDSTAPEANLSTEQINDMMEAMSATGAFTFGSATGQAPANASVVTVSETVDCPNGGTYSMSGSANSNDLTGSFTAQFTQTYTACKVTSSSGALWTFSGNPNVVTNISATVNPTNGAFTLTGTQVGGISFSTDGASGTCSINLSMSLSSTIEGTVAVNVSGKVCGKTVEYSYEETA